MRTCENCSECCYIGGVPELNKLPHTTCAHLENNCSIFNSPDRPKTCSSFICSWLEGYGTEEDRPDKSGVMISVGIINGNLFIYAIELRSGGMESNILFDIAQKIDLPVVIISHMAKPPNDCGDYVLVKKSLEHRITKMVGKLIKHINDEFNLYELRRT